MDTMLSRFASAVGAVSLAALLSVTASSCAGGATSGDPYAGLTDTMEIATTEFRITMVKARLKDLGFYQGPIDKEWDGETREAVRRYQRARGLTPDGKYSLELVDRIMVKEASW